jgi:hypothetical protein
MEQGCPQWQKRHLPPEPSRGHMILESLINVYVAQGFGILPFSVVKFWRFSTVAESAY